MAQVLSLERARRQEERRARRGLRDRIPGYLKDPFLRRLHDEIEAAGPMRAITVDLTHVCQLRCEGCYFFAEQMDDSKSPKDEAEFDAFIEAERSRGTNYMTVLGGEPSLALPRLKKLSQEFMCLTVTNGIRRIPMEGFEDMSVAISVWGDHELDTELRGAGKIDVFAKGLRNYKDDPRAGWYFTASAGNANVLEDVVTECVENGNYLYFNYYEDNADLGGRVDHRIGFGQVRSEIDKMIDRYPEKVLTTSYMAEVSTTNRLFGQEWGYDVCATLSSNYEKNFERLKNGNPYNPHFRAYNPDLKSVRRCCVGEDRDCSQCYNAYARHTWIMINRDLHLETRDDYTNWLTSVYMFYLAARAVDWHEGVKLLPEIHERVSAIQTRRAGA
jgi:MoaA/NifB/PqqE/SkfB family radical SAM enzyme